MDEELTKKIKWVKEKLRGQEVQDLALFDVKEGQDGEDGAPHYYETYLEKTRKNIRENMRALFQETEWGALTPWQKMCCYKISGSNGVDCDAALRSTVIYKLAFGGGEIVPKKRIYLLKHNGFILRGDTMNSYATTVHEFLRTYVHEEEKVKEFLTKTKSDVWGTRNRRKANWEVCILENYDYFSGIRLSECQKFFDLYHTVGNFIPWPDGCNVPRGSGPVKDYWDLTLKCIHQWYQDNKNLTMPSNDALLHLFGSQMVIFHDWLASYGQGMDGWDNFVKRNFLQDFVENGKPRELWGGHFDTWEKGGFTRTAAMPTGPQFKDFFANASEWIEARGKKIAEAVKAALEEPGAAAGEIHA